MKPHNNKNMPDIEPKLIEKTDIKHTLGIWFIITLMLLLIIGNVGLMMMNISLDDTTNRKYFIPIWIGTMMFCLIAFTWTKIYKAQEQTSLINPKTVKGIGLSIAVICCLGNISILAYDWVVCEKIELQQEKIIQAKITEIDHIFDMHDGRTHYLGVHAGKPTNARGYPDKDGYDMYTSFDITPKGKINTVTYYIKTETHISKEKALEKIERKYAKLVKISSEVKMDKELKKKYPLSTDFKQDFLKDDEWISILENSTEDSNPKQYELKNTKNIKASMYFEIDKIENVGIVWINITKKDENNAP